MAGATAVSLSASVFEEQEAAALIVDVRKNKQQWKMEEKRNRLCLLTQNNSR